MQPHGNAVEIQDEPTRFQDLAGGGDGRHRSCRAACQHDRPQCGENDRLGAAALDEDGQSVAPALPAREIRAVGEIEALLSGQALRFGRRGSALSRRSIVEQHHEGRRGLKNGDDERHAPVLAHGATHVDVAADGADLDYGYVVVDAGPHPNPRKAAEGFRLRVLAIEEETAAVVRRIFTEYLNGNGDRAIANGLNRDGIPCPSARRPEQNRHRLADGWQGSTIRSILENPRYTGYAFFGRWARQEMLLDPDDVAAGHVTRFRRASADRVVRSRKPAHPEIISVEDFTAVQLSRRSRAAGGLEARRKLERGPKATKWTYAFRGRVRCDHCKRKMEGTPRDTRIYYRCAARTLVPGSPALADHPKNIYLPEAALMDPLNSYIHHAFSEEQRDATVEAMLGVAGDVNVNPRRTADAQRWLTQAKTRLARLTQAIEAGADLEALIEPLNRAREERDAAAEELARTPAGSELGRADVEALVDSLADAGRRVISASPARLQELYEEIGLELVYNARERMVAVTIRPPRRVSTRVRGGTRSLLLARIPFEREFVMLRVYQIRSSWIGIRCCCGRVGEVRRLARRSRRRFAVRGGGVWQEASGEPGLWLVDWSRDPPQPRVRGVEARILIDELMRCGGIGRCGCRC